ncbi:hypothetical protein ACLOJK_000162 [Asimina triloba]
MGTPFTVPSRSPEHGAPPTTPTSLHLRRRREQQPPSIRKNSHPRPSTAGARSVFSSTFVRLHSASSSQSPLPPDLAHSHRRPAPPPTSAAASRRHDLVRRDPAPPKNPPNLSHRSSPASATAHEPPDLHHAQMMAKDDPMPPSPAAAPDLASSVQSKPAPAFDPDPVTNAPPIQPATNDDSTIPPPEDPPPLLASGTPTDPTPISSIPRAPITPTTITWAKQRSAPPCDATSSPPNNIFLSQHIPPQKQPATPPIKRKERSKGMKPWQTIHQISQHFGSGMIFKK